MPAQAWATMDDATNDAPDAYNRPTKPSLPVSVTAIQPDESVETICPPAMATISDAEALQGLAKTATRPSAPG